MSKKENDPLFRPTARDCLVDVGGEEHATHSVVRKVVHRREIIFWCSCGSRLFVERTKGYNGTDSALRNIIELQ